jgi:nucleoside phosphorylase
MKHVRHILIACALKLELQALETGLSGKICVLGRDRVDFNECGVALLRCGLGKAKAAVRLKESLNSLFPDFVLNFGLAGALASHRSDLKRGVLVIADTILDCCENRMSEANPKYESDSEAIAIAHKMNIPLARLASLPQPLESIAENRKIAGIHDVEMVDMEAAAAHEICYEKGIRCATMKVISDYANEQTNEDFFQYSVHSLHKAMPSINSYVTSLLKGDFD